LAVDQATVYLCSALELLEGCAGRVRTAERLSATERAHILADLANLAAVIDDALHA
jgi:hypothetical protein